MKFGFDNVGIFDNKKSRSILEMGDGTIIFEGKCNFGHGFKLCIGNGATLRIGRDFNLTAESTIVCSKDIRFGHNCLLSWDILIMDTDFHKIVSPDHPNRVMNEPSPIVVGNNVWIGCRSTVLKGTTIADGAIIGAASLVHGVFSDKNTIFAGVPAQKIRSGVGWRM